MNVILDETSLRRTITRLSHEIAEKCGGLQEVALMGIKRGGEAVSSRVAAELFRLFKQEIPNMGLDIGMTRDDLVSSSLVPEATKNDPHFSVEGKTVIVCDDVLHTGRAALAAIEAVFRMGRPARIMLLVLVDRGGREVPVGADFVGKNIPTSKREYVRVNFTELGDKQDGFILEERD